MFFLMEPRLAWVIDRTRVIETVDRLFVLTDQRDWEGLTQLFGERVAYDMTSLAGGEPAELPADAIVASWREALTPVAAVHHQSGNHLVTIDGDRAEVFCYATATHHQPGQEKRLTTYVGSYDFTLDRAGSGWLIVGFRFNKKYVE